MSSNRFTAIPSLEKMLRRHDIAPLVEGFGHQPVLAQLRRDSESIRAEIAAGNPLPDAEALSDRLALMTIHAMNARHTSGYRAVLNLTGTVLHTNLGRAVLPDAAADAMHAAATHPVTVEFELESGTRGDRDRAIETLLCELTGAEAACVVNNNAAAVLLALNSLACGREVIVSRGELVEIGGSFRMPQIMAASGCVLAEVGTTNRTHLDDFAGRINDRTAALMTVHPSNYQIQGFTHQVARADLATLAHQHDLPLIDDLGSGSLIGMGRFGLPDETTVAQAVRAGADLVTFSGDKLLGGPQCGMIVGRKNLIEQLNKNPMKRALRLDKLRLAGLESVLRLYRHPDELAAQLPGLRQMTRSLAEIEATAKPVLQSFEQTLGALARFSIVQCHSQIGSGALPVDLLPSLAVAIDPAPAAAGRGSELNRWAGAMRRLAQPVIGRISQDQLLLDMRTLEDPLELTKQLAQLNQLLTDSQC